MLAPVTNLAGRFMLHALRIAERGWGQTAPNPLVGAVVVRDGDIVGEGWHARYGGAHAEVNAIRAAGDRARGGHLFVTLEPCAHHGKTPPCTDAIIAARIAKVTIATLDPTHAGGGAELLRRAGLNVEIGLEEKAARELNAGFHFAAAASRPWITLKLAVSSDGAIAGPASADGSRAQAWLTGDDARREVHRMRAGVDAVAVGSGTVLSDDPLLTVRHFDQPRVPPVRVVFDRQARTPVDAQLVRTARTVPVVVVAGEHNTRTAALGAQGVEIIVAGDLTDALRQLHARGVRSMLVEGGAGLAGALLNEGYVDRVVLLRSPRVLGAGGLAAFAHVHSPDDMLQALEIRETRQLGTDLMEVCAVRGHDV